MTLSICIAQLNFVAGDLPGNARRIIEAARRAHAAGAQLLLTPELALCGGIAEDLFLRPAFMAACDAALAQVARETADLAGLTLVVGHPAHRANVASVIREGRVIAAYAKHELTHAPLFDERRYFTPGDGVCVLEVAGVKAGLLIGEDACADQPAQRARAAGAQVLAVINASPFHAGKVQERQAHMQAQARAHGLPLVVANLVGGQDGVVFDGHSFAVGADGQIAARAPGFEEQLVAVQAQRAQDGALHLRGDVAPQEASEAGLWSALVLGLRDYVCKNGFSGVVLGLSGGIDSALVLALAVDALGADAVRTVMMPSPYTASISVEDAREMARRMGVRHDEIDILPVFEAFKTSLAPLFAGRPEDLTEENIQARIRGVMLMALSNKFGGLVLSTGNKSESAAGYCTLYGDMCGGYAPIIDVVKTTVFKLARWRNAHDPYGRGANPIPERIITRAPSAELRPDQTDQDSLPPYEVVDAIIARYMEDDMSIDELVAAGYRREDVEKVARLIKISEYKRHQAATGTRVTQRAFGKDWRYPITNRFLN
jgi:NAD+ synthase (glutamine-hydrolysing)